MFFTNITLKLINTYFFSRKNLYQYLLYLRKIIHMKRILLTLSFISVFLTNDMFIYNSNAQSIELIGDNYVFGNPAMPIASYIIVKNITSKGFVRSNYEEKLVDLSDVRINLKTKN